MTEKFKNNPFEEINGLDLAELNVRYSELYEEEEGDIQDSLMIFEHILKKELPLLTLLQTRCIITVHLLCFLFHGSSSKGWKRIKSQELFDFPYVSIILQERDSSDEEEESNEFEVEKNKDHAMFLFKSEENFYLTQSYCYNKNEYHEPFTEKITDTNMFLRSIVPPRGYEYIIWAPNSDHKNDSTITKRAQFLQNSNNLN